MWQPAYQRCPFKTVSPCLPTAVVAFLWSCVSKIKKYTSNIVVISVNSKIGFPALEKGMFCSVSLEKDLWSSMGRLAREPKYSGAVLVQELVRETPPLHSSELITLSML